MKYTKLALMIAGLLLTCFTAEATANAEGSRSYIAPSGSDNRQCTRSQPCRTFDGALAKTDAGGEIMALETGTYDPTTITKSITLTAAPSADVVIRATSANAVTINVAPDDTVVLRGLKLSGPGQNTNTNGVLVEPESRGAILIENCVITNFGTGVLAIINHSAKLALSDSVLRNNNTGLAASSNGTDDMGASATRTRFERNLTGVRALVGKAVVLHDCVAAGNLVGFLAEPNGKLVVVNSLVTRNNRGIETVENGQAFIAYSNISGNDIGIKGPGTVSSMGNNVIVGNELSVSGPPLVIVAGK